MTSPDGKFKWTITARTKSSDKQPVPTLELYPRFRTKPYKIRYGQPKVWINFPGGLYYALLFL